MTLPVQSQIVDALLKVIHELDRPTSIDEHESLVAEVLGLSNDDATQIHDGTRTRLGYKLAWARTQLKGLGILQSPDRGVWVLTQPGKRLHSISDLSDSALEELNELFDEKQDVEGLDKNVDQIGEYPLDSVLIRQETRTVYEVVRRINDNQFIMDPDFQRDFVWDLDKQSKLIESMVMRIPLPVFYLAERDDGRTVVVDGLQRLSTFVRFLKDEFPLRPLALAPELNGLRFSNLPAKLKNRLEDTQLILYVIDPKVPEQAKLDIFERVNGGVPLTRQQMRNSIYSGDATQWLKAAVSSPEFKSATAGSLDSKSMRDRECVNRFAAFSTLGVGSYTRADMDGFLAQALKQINKQPNTVAQLDMQFRTSMKNNLRVFGAHSFRKHKSDVDRRSVINVALFDVFSVLMGNITEADLEPIADEVRTRFYELMNDPNFMDSISQSTNSTTKVQSRFLLARRKLSDLIPNVN